jgi:hypothetical protein
MFDLIAPIAIYLYADSTYEKEAEEAYNKIKEKDISLRSIVDGLNKSEEFDGFLNNVDFKDLYNEYFEEVALEYLSEVIDVDNITTEYDTYGAKQLRHPEYGIMFTGDDSRMFPYYDSSNAIKERVNKYTDEYNNK